MTLNTAAAEHWRLNVEESFIRTLSRLCAPDRITLFDLSSGERMAGAPVHRRLCDKVRRLTERFLTDFVTELDDRDHDFLCRVLEADGIPCALAVFSGAKPLERTPEREARFGSACDLLTIHLGDRLRAANGENESREHRERLEFMIRTFSFQQFATRDLGGTLHNVIENLQKFRQIEGGFIYIEPIHPTSIIDQASSSSDPLEPELLRAIATFVKGLSGAVFIDDHLMISHLIRTPVPFSSVIAAPIRCGRRHDGGECPLHLGRGGDDFVRYPCPCWSGGVFLWNRTGMPFGLRDRDFIQIIVERLVFHFLYHNINNERQRERQERELARQIQVNLLPRSTPAIDGIEIRTHNLCAEVVGGDFYEFHSPRSTVLMIAIGDISGKSVPAALLHSLIQRVLHSEMARLEASGIPRAGAILTKVNADLYDSLLSIDMFATLFLVRLDTRTGRLEYANAGHTLPIVHRAATGATETFTLPGMPIGWMPDATYETGAITLAPGDSVLLYTDGMTEVFDDRRDMFGEARLRQAVADTAGEPVDRALSGIVARAREFSGNADLADDQSAILFRYTGPGPDDDPGQN